MLFRQGQIGIIGLMASCKTRLAERPAPPCPAPRLPGVSFSVRPLLAISAILQLEAIMSGFFLVRYWQAFVAGRAGLWRGLCVH